MSDEPKAPREIICAVRLVGLTDPGGIVLRLCNACRWVVRLPVSIRVEEARIRVGAGEEAP